MVAGKVKAVMGLQKSPATPKLEAARRSSSSPNTFKGVGQVSNGKASVFSRSFGVYFPRSSAQVQPRPPDVADLIRLVEELQEKESRLRTEILEQKILKETVAVVPFLEKEVAAKNEELDRVKKGIEVLEADNRALRMEVEALLVKIREVEDEGRKKEVEIEELKRTVSEQQGELRRLCCGAVEINDCSSSSSRFQGLLDVSSRSILLRNIRRSPKSTDIASNPDVSKPDVKIRKGEDRETDLMHHLKEEMPKPRPPRVPKPPPLPSTSSYSSMTIAGTRNAVPNQAAAPPIPPPPPPPPPPPATAANKGANAGAASVRRVPEVVEFYHSLMRRDTKRDSASGVGDAPSAANARNMIGEIENRSTHLLAIKTDVETQGDFIRFLIKEVENAAFSNIEDLVSFVKWLDDELSFLVDERAVLKHFDWPEAKSDAMREAAFGYCDLRKLELEASSFCYDPRQPCASAIKKMQSLLEKLEHGIFSLSRVREGATERYKNFLIPWDWMLDSGIVSQIKLASVKLAMKYMKRVTSEISVIAGGPDEEDLMLQGVRFAFRVHQFAGGFDVETMRAFQKLKDKARKRQADRQNQQQQQKVLNRSTSSPTPC